MLYYLINWNGMGTRCAIRRWDHTG